MSSFLTDVETEEDFQKALRDGINEIKKTSEPQSPTPKPQSPSRKRSLEDDGSLPADSSPDHRPMKQHKRLSSDSSRAHGPKKKAASRVRSNDGQLEWLDKADAQWKPAGYHRDYRAQLLAFSVQQPGASDWTPALGTNCTSYSPLIQNWTKDPHTVRDSKGRCVFEMENAPIDWDDDPPYGHLTYNGLILLDHESRPVRDIPGLPLTLATGSKGWLLEGLRRCTRIEVNDFIARYPSKIGYSTLVQAMGRWTESIGIRKWENRKTKKTKPAVTTSDSERSTILASPIISQKQSGRLNVGSSGQEWPLSPESSSQCTHALGPAYSRDVPYYSMVGNSAPSPWDVESSSKPWSLRPQSNRGNCHRGGNYSNVPQTSYYDQKHTESIVRRVIGEQRKQPGSRASKPNVIPQSAAFQPHSSIRPESWESLFPRGDFYSAQPTNIMESNFVQSMLEYSRSHYRTLMSREPPVTTTGASYTYQYWELQAHLEQLWPYLGIPPGLRAVAPVSGTWI